MPAPALLFRAGPPLACPPVPLCHSRRPPFGMPAGPPLSFPPAPLCHSRRPPSVIPAGPPLSFPPVVSGNPVSCFFVPLFVWAGMGEDLDSRLPTSGMTEGGLPMSGMTEGGLPTLGMTEEGLEGVGHDGRPDLAPLLCPDLITPHPGPLPQGERGAWHHGTPLFADGCVGVERQWGRRHDGVNRGNRVNTGQGLQLNGRERHVHAVEREHDSGLCGTLSGNPGHVHFSLPRTHN